MCMGLNGRLVFNNLNTISWTPATQEDCIEAGGSFCPTCMLRKYAPYDTMVSRKHLGPQINHFQTSSDLVGS